MSDIKTALADYADKAGTPSHIVIIRAVASRPGTAREIAKAAGLTTGAAEQAIIKLCRLGILSPAGERPFPTGNGRRARIYTIASVTGDTTQKKTRRHPQAPQHRLTMAGQLGIATKSTNRQPTARNPA